MSNLQKVFYSKIAKTDTCWIWNGNTTKGYGQVNVNGKKARAHRLSYELANGPINDSALLVCHTCDNPLCVNPTHLFLGPAVANTKDMLSKGRNANQRKTECKNGHPFTPENTKMNGTNRECKICRNAREHAKRSR